VLPAWAVVEAHLGTVECGWTTAAVLSGWVSVMDAHFATVECGWTTAGRRKG
jgi:hypothetical protein